MFAATSPAAKSGCDAFAASKLEIFHGMPIGPSGMPTYRAIAGYRWLIARARGIPWMQTWADPDPSVPKT